MTSTLTDLWLGSDDGLDTRAVQLSICRVDLMGKLIAVVANEMRGLRHFGEVKRRTL
jgi:hypothetical protein